VGKWQRCWRNVNVNSRRQYTILCTILTVNYLLWNWSPSGTTQLKIKVVLIHDTKAYRRGRGTTPLIRFLGTRWRWVVNNTPFLLFLWWKKKAGIHWLGGWILPRDGISGFKERKTLAFPGFAPLIVQAVAWSLYHIHHPGSLVHSNYWQKLNYWRQNKRILLLWYSNVSMFCTFRIALEGCYLYLSFERDHNKICLLPVVL
jgi:hypothetical protein